MKRLGLSTATIAVVATAAGGALAINGDAPTTQSSRTAANPPLPPTAAVSIVNDDHNGLIAWEPTTVEQLVAGSDAVVVGRVAELGPGEPLQGVDPQNPAEETHPIPTERAVITPEREIATSPNINAPRSDFPVYEDVAPEGDAEAGAGGTGLVAGERYILFLRESDQVPGRYWLSTPGTAIPIDRGVVSEPRTSGAAIDGLIGRPISEAVTALGQVRASIPNTGFGESSPNPSIAARNETRKAFGYSENTGSSSTTTGYGLWARTWSLPR